MSVIEKEIIATVLSQEEYKQVRFLEPKYFTDTMNQKIWQLILKFKGDTLEMVARLEATERHHWMNVVANGCLGTWSTNISQMGLKLVEMRFERFFIILITDLIGKSQSMVEKSLLSEIRQVVGDKDIFDLSDSALDYLGDHSSDMVKKRINDFIEYRNKRIGKIKELTNGN